MKKTMLVLLAALLMLYSVAACAEVYTAGDYFTIEYDDEMSLDDTTYVDDSTEEDIWLFMIYNDEFLIESYWTIAEEYDDFNMSEADRSELAMYLAEVTESFSGSDLEHVGVVTSTAGIRFYAYQLNDDYGSYYYAETIEDGVCVSFLGYYMDGSIEPDDVLLEMFLTLLETYVPLEAE